MITVKFIVNIDSPVYGEFEEIINLSDWADNDHVKYEVLDIGSKKHLRKARGYFSKYASSEVFVVLENEELEQNKVIDVIYKEEAIRSSWEILLKKKLEKHLNEHQ